LEKAGAALISIHGRTKEQGYTGKADWELIAEAKNIASVPLLANGDIHQSIDVGRALAITHADGVLIGRGALGNPWFFAQVKDPARIISWEERKRVILRHATLHVEHYGEKAMVTFRKHLAWYFKGTRMNETVPEVKLLRQQLMQVETYQELVTILDAVGI
jgi:tRNA-dihydrouridine synthase